MKNKPHQGGTRLALFASDNDQLTVHGPAYHAY